MPQPRLGIAVLDATEAGRKVYAPLGFRDLYPISRWEGSPPTQATAPATYEASAAVRPLPAEDLDGLAAWDRVRFGADRAPVLRHLRQAASHLAHVAEDAGGNLVTASPGPAAWLHNSAPSSRTTQPLRRF